MFSIGEFSKLCMVTTKTLRHYDSIGLLKPSYLNEQNGYRYYSTTQLTDMMFILRLKEYGFSLVEIAMLLPSGKDALQEQLQQKLLSQKQILLEQRDLLERMEKDINTLKKGKDIMEMKPEVTIVETKPLEILSARDTIAIKDFGLLFSKLYGKIGQTGAVPTGAPIAIYHCEDFDPQSSDVEVGLPIAQPVDGSRVLPGGTAVTATHKGTYSNLNNTYAALAQWIDENGWKIAAPPYEVYMNDPKDTAEKDLITQIYFPVSK